MRVLVTGGAGFIGSHLVARLVEEGHSVRVLDNFFSGTRRNLAAVAQDVEVIEGDIRDLDVVAGAAEGVEVVFHLAALGSVPRSVASPLETNEVNVQGTLRVLMAARDAGAERVIFASSSAVYGETPTLPKTEEMPTLPTSPYGVSKQAAESYCNVFWKTYGLATVSLRYFNVFGPRQDPASQYAAVIPKFVTRALSGRPLVVYGDGEQSRDFTYVDNVVHANLLAMRAASGFGSAYNVAMGGHLTVNELAAQVIAGAGADASIQHEPPRTGDIRHSFAATARAEAVLGYAPQVTLREGLGRTIAWYQSNGNVKELFNAGPASRG